MDAFVQFLIDYGYLGMFLSAFLAGTVFPFNSELVMIGLAAPSVGLNPFLLVLWGTVGNVAGGMTCYWLGHLGKMEWIEKYGKVKPEKLEKAQRFLQGRGAWMAFFAFLPIIGSAISIVLGMMRANIWITLIAMTIGKALRYSLCAFVPGWIA
ncbi:MAG: DedA family protein [Bacteroidaceae bacterium]|nr:DedA family protein [Candidatus Minthousia equi]MCQ2246867.1 DedA family protein [Bacteroidaceae bacterium]MDO4955757.1 YqaA family protein [Bacteroidales bacterium]